MAEAWTGLSRFKNLGEGFYIRKCGSIDLSNHIFVLDYLINSQPELLFEEDCRG